MKCCFHTVPSLYLTVLTSSFYLTILRTKISKFLDKVIISFIFFIQWRKHASTGPIWEWDIFIFGWTITLRKSRYNFSSISNIGLLVCLMLLSKKFSISEQTHKANQLKKNILSLTGGLIINLFTYISEMLTQV